MFQLQFTFSISHCKHHNCNTSSSSSYAVLSSWVRALGKRLSATWAQAAENRLRAKSFINASTFDPKNPMAQLQFLPHLVD